jgi:polysaccharide export outer membrane protein/exopolysaccharide production protein ExoF
MKALDQTLSLGISGRFPVGSAPHRLVQRCGFLSFALILLVNMIAGPVMGADYLLGPSDKVRVKAYEWRASRDEIFEWDALNDEFTVSAGGTLSLPFVGEVRASGITTRELAGTIADRLRSGMGLGRQPDMSIEIVQFRPFYIVGLVDHPGEFPYRPGLTVLQALSIAGGLPKVNDGLMRLGRDAISARGDLQVLGVQTAYLRARKARLEAELKQSDTVDLPRGPTAHPTDASVELALQQEASIFQVRREAFSTQMHVLEQLKDFLDKEVASLIAQRGTEERQVQLVKKELATVSLLVDKGLSAVPRQLGLERTVAQIEGERLRIETSLLRAKQEISRTEIAMLELKNKRETEVTNELRETQSKLAELDRRSETADQLLYEAEVTAPQLMAQRARSRRMQPAYTIVRLREEKAVELSASESTTVEPGDTIKVEVPLGNTTLAADAFTGLTDIPSAAAFPTQPAAPPSVQ